MINEQEREECRQVQLKLLGALDAICKKHQLTYWIDFGTLLGAVRHGGFIPWDDDIDVSMPIADYRKFIEIGGKELPRDVFLQIPQTDKAYKQYFAKLRDCYSTFLEHHETGTEPYHHGIYIDIFPSVVYPRMPRMLRRVLTYATLRTRENTFVKSKNVVLNYSAYLFCKLIWFIFSPFRGDKIGQTPEDNGYMYAIPLEYLYPLKDIKFESRLYPGPGKPHEYLSVIYKNYMTPPTPEKRIVHAKTILPHTPCNHPRALHK
ncbi:MAG: LicD family protein [Candidatus Pacebacteria bacterium]|nr:LicD family protein [Candidatus Paceibacterota bacterium]MDD5356539.1 LicD family protein [Candidatus Paceibacterota bacterium]